MDDAHGESLTSARDLEGKMSGYGTAAEAPG